MRIVNIFAAPYSLIAAFCLLLISGEHLGGFYLLYLLLALPHGGLHALLALAGIALLVLTHKYGTREGFSAVRLTGAVAGVALMIGSLYAFFNYNATGYNDGTFEQAVPIATFILAGCLAFVFLFCNILFYVRVHKSDPDLAPRSK